jgi:hypothetical protein
VGAIAGTNKYFPYLNSVGAQFEAIAGTNKYFPYLNSVGPQFEAIAGTNKYFPYFNSVRPQYCTQVGVDVAKMRVGDAGKTVVRGLHVQRAGDPIPGFRNLFDGFFFEKNIVINKYPQQI